MTTTTSPAPGTFSWVELSTTDQKAAGVFYPALFGWELRDFPIGPAETYSMFFLGGHDVGAAYTMREDERKHGVPPHWNLYITVVSADETAKRAEALGGKVLAPPFDVMDQGRMAVLQDPTGAVFHVWQSKAHIGGRVRNEPGALCWSELTTRDPKRAEAFYTALFGWDVKHGAASAVMEYTEFGVGGEWSAGMMAMPKEMPPHVPSYWMPYFQVTDCDLSTRKATELGGSVMVAPQDIPGTGRFSIVKDPQGAMFALFRFGAA